VTHQLAARKFMAHLSATRRFHATAARIPNEVAPCCPKKQSLGPSGYWFNQLQAFGAARKWSTKARDILWKKIHPMLVLIV
jgi:hypothetical protein